LALDEARESAALLKNVQAWHLGNALSAAQVSQAQIQGVGPQLKSALMANGIMSARDVDRLKVVRIQGFGPARVSAVLAWANSVEAQARATMIQTLPLSRAQAIRAKYEGRCQVIGAALQPAEGQQRTEEAAIKARFAPMRQELDNLEATPRTAAQRDIRAIQGRLDESVRLLRRERERVFEDTKRELAALETKIGRLRKSSFKLQREKALAAQRVNAYAPVSFGRYLRHVVFSAGKVG